MQPKGERLNIFHVGFESLPALTQTELKATMYTDAEIDEFLRESNAVEGEYSEIALEDAWAAWNYAVELRHKLSPSAVLIIHRLLIENLRSDIAGEFRQCDVWVGGDRRPFVSVDVFVTELDKITLAVSRTSCVGTPDEWAKANHIRFEKLHPFVDGNGRVGRILYNIHRLNLGLPIHIIHQGAEQQEYYTWFE